MDSASSPSWMTSTSCVHPRGSTRYMGSCSMHSFLILRSGSTTVRPRFGIVAASFLGASRCCRQCPESTTLTPSSGEAIAHCAMRRKACGFWALRWATQSSSVLSRRLCPRRTISCWRRSSIQDFQYAWLLLLFCCGARANYTLRVVHPGLTTRFAAHRHASLRRPTSGCRHLLGSCQPAVVSGRLGFPKSHFALQTRFLVELGRLSGDGATKAPHRLCSYCGRPQCSAPFFPLGRGPRLWVRPEQLRWDEDMEPGWQRSATEHVHGLLVEGTIRPRLSDRAGVVQVATRSVGWCPFHVLPHIQDGLFILPCASPSAPLASTPSPSSRFCRCGRPLDASGHHRAACAQSGVLGRRGYALESAVARVCREAGARVSTNVLVRDLDLLPLQHVDARRLEVVADGLPLFHGAQIAVDTTLVSPLRRDGTPPTVVAHGKTALLCVMPARGKSAFIQSSQGHMDELDWSFSPVKWEADGLQRRKLSSVNWRGQSLAKNLPPSAPARNSRGSGGGA